MKAVIMTFHAVPNYGAALQAYALQETLKKYFDTVEIVDYMPKYLENECRYFNFYSIFSLALSAWSFTSFAKKMSAFKKFRQQHFLLTKISGKTTGDLCGIEADVVFLGSDQIWNPEITDGFDPAFFGKINWNKKTIIASYAASIGKATLSSKEQTEIIKLISNLDYISVREIEAKNLLQPYTEKNICAVVDPTVLAGRKCFDGLISPVRQSNYILMYSLTRNPETETLAVKISKYLGKPIIELSGKRKGIVRKRHKAIYTAGPSEFLSLIAHADFVVTDSFHGTVFSLLYHKKFISIPHKTRGGRIVDLLSMCGLSERMTSRFDTQLIEEDITWESVDKKIETAREESENYIMRVTKKYV